MGEARDGSSRDESMNESLLRTSEYYLGSMALDGEIRRRELRRPRRLGWVDRQGVVDLSERRDV